MHLRRQSLLTRIQIRLSNMIPFRTVSTTKWWSLSSLITSFGKRDWLIKKKSRNRQTLLPKLSFSKFLVKTLKLLKMPAIRYMRHISSIRFRMKGSWSSFIKFGLNSSFPISRGSLKRRPSLDLVWKLLRPTRSYFRRILTKAWIFLSMTWSLNSCQFLIVALAW